MGISDILMMLGGLALFLLGMKLMSEGLEMAAGSRLRRMLEVLTSRRIVGMLVGAVVTMVIQSSSATTVMVIGFVNAGLISLTQAIGVIMGANVGTTVTGVLVALNPVAIAPIALFIGVIAVTFIKKKNIVHTGQIFVGLGLLFMGLNNMSTAMAPLREFQPFIDLMVSFADNPILGIMAGMLVTAVIQSSSASIAILQALAMQGAIPNIKAAVFILIGQNIGTCITALLASIGTTRNAKRAAIIHLMFNVIGAIMFTIVACALPFDTLLVNAFDDPAKQIALAHIVFNITTTLFLLPFADIIVKLATKVIPGEEKVDGELHLEFLDPRILNTPPIAVTQVLREVERMADVAAKNLHVSMEALFEVSEEKINEVYEREKLVDFLNHSITSYLIKIGALELQEEDAKTIGALFHVVNDIERIGDHAENIADGARSCFYGNIRLSQSAKNELMDMFKKTDDLYGMAIDRFKLRESVKDKNLDRADEINAIEEQIDTLADVLEFNHVKRLTNNKCSPETGMVFINIVSNLERIADHSTNVAFAISKTKRVKQEVEV